MSVIAISQQAPCTFRASRSMKIGFAHFRTQDQPVTPTIHVLSLTVTLKGSLYITFGPRFSRNFLFAFENGTIIHPSRPSQHRENDLPRNFLFDRSSSAAAQPKVAPFVAYFAGRFAV